MATDPLRKTMEPGGLPNSITTKPQTARLHIPKTRVMMGKVLGNIGAAVMIIFGCTLLGEWTPTKFAGVLLVAIGAHLQDAFNPFGK